jgi:hypothetical protein
MARVGRAGQLFRGFDLPKVGTSPERVPDGELMQPSDLEKASAWLRPE